MDYSEALEYAQRVAFRMSVDVETQSIAGVSARRAVDTFDPTLGVPIKRHIARCVKMDIWSYWRKIKHRREEQKESMWWEEVWCFDEPEEELRVSTDDWQLLHEHYTDRWPMDVIARRRNTTIYQIKKMLRAAEQRFVSAYQDNSEVPI